MKIIALCNQKGGCGKSTTSIALAEGLTGKGYSVLLIDLDPQCNMSLYTGVIQSANDGTMWDVFKRNKTMTDIIRKGQQNFDVAQSSITLSAADMEFTCTGREYILREVLEQAHLDYDYCIIDTPPTLGILTVNALTAADGVIIPVNADLWSMQGLEQLQQLIKSNKKYCNSNLAIYGLLMTDVNGREKVTKDIQEYLEGVAISMDTKLFATVIRRSVAIKECILCNADFFKEAPKAGAVIDYQAFIEELLGGGTIGN